MVKKIKLQLLKKFDQDIVGLAQAYYIGVDITGTFYWISQETIDAKKVEFKNIFTIVPVPHGGEYHSVEKLQDGSEYRSSGKIQTFILKITEYIFVEIKYVIPKSSLTMFLRSIKLKRPKMSEEALDHLL